MAPFSLFGLIIGSYLLRNHPDNPWASYGRYMIFVVVASLILFTVFHTFLKIDNWLFYPVAAVSTFLVGYNPGNAIQYIQKIASSFRK